MKERQERAEREGGGQPSIGARPVKPPHSRLCFNFFSLSFLPCHQIPLVTPHTLDHKSLCKSQEVDIEAFPIGSWSQHTQILGVVNDS